MNDQYARGRKGAGTSDSLARALLRERSLADDGWLRAGLAGASAASVQDESDRAEMFTTRELLLTLRFRVVSHRREIETALSRLADGVYGACLDCGQPIEAKRLHALPWAERCHPCQATIEQRQGPDGGKRR
jgi:DnaK suppressor protein